MSLLTRLWHIIKDPSDPNTVATTIALRERADELRNDTARIIRESTNQASGIWPADLVRGVYRPERREFHPDE